MAGKFLSLEEAARRLGVSIDEVNRLVDRKELFPMRDGATIKFKVDEIERVAASLGVGAADGGDDDLALDLELSSPGLGGSLLGAGSGGSGGGLSLGDPVDDDSIFAGDGDGGAVAGSQTVVRGGGGPVLGSGTFDVDDLALEASILGIDGWVAGSGIAFPDENQHFWELTRKGAWDEARELYRWFTPLLHLDTHPKFVQYIKLAVQETGLGKEWVRAPRLPLSGAERKAVLKVIHDGIASRPKLPKKAQKARR
jgi:excisionase family DNA binding protein